MQFQRRLTFRLRRDYSALTESWSGTVVRKHGPSQRCASLVNAFCAGYLNPYVSFYCLRFFPEAISDAKGKEWKKYCYEDMNMPYE